MATDSRKRPADIRERPKTVFLGAEKSVKPTQRGKKENLVKKILMGLVSLALVIGLLGVGTMAYFSDTEESTGNTFTAGTLDLGEFGTFAWGDVAPGDVNTETFDLTNSGSIDAASVYLELNVVDSGGAAALDPEVEAEAGVPVDDISTQIEITAMTYTGSAGTVSILPLYSDDNANGWLDLDDLNSAGEVEINGADALSAGETATVVIVMTLRTDTENEYQGDLSTVDELARITQD